TAPVVRLLALWLIWLQRPDATRVAGFHTWLRLGRAVHRGECGIAMLAPRPYRRTATNEQGEQVEGRRGLSVASATLCGIAQTCVVDAARWQALEEATFFLPPSARWATTVRSSWSSRDRMVRLLAGRRPPGHQRALAGHQPGHPGL